jgi:hypothetical protein
MRKLMLLVATAAGLVAATQWWRQHRRWEPAS